MKNLYFILTLALVFLSCNSTRQNTENKSVTTNSLVTISGATMEYDPHPERTKLAKLHDKLIHSESFILSEKLMSDFIYSFPEDMNPAFEDDAALFDWVKENLSKTTFKSPEEAVELWHKTMEATMKDHEDNAEYYEVWLNTDVNSWESTHYGPYLSE